MKQYTSIELFAGAGGLALGLEEAGFKHLGLVEFNKYAAATLRKNRPNWNVFEEDVTQIVGRDLEKEFKIKRGKLDLLSGGAPCQAFSYAGKGLGLEDTRGTMFYYFAKFLSELRPKMFLFENVKGLLSHDDGKTYRIIRNVFEQEGYHVHCQIMNSNDYGVPQNRERLITIGVRKDLKYPFMFKWPKEIDLKSSLGTCLLKNPDKDTYPEYSEKKKKLFPLIPIGGCWKDLPRELAIEYMGEKWVNSSMGGSTGCLRRLNPNRPSPTILTSPSMKMTEFCHPYGDRPLSYRESARVQTFPDSWEFEGSLMEKYRQIGNAVPVELAFHVGRAIVNKLSVS